jgi:tRNA (guanine37-N1)-methyltransferase
MINFHVITLFPESFDSYLGESILARAQKEKKIAVRFYDPRDFVKPTKTQSQKNKPYLRVDDKPYGGGPGMVMQALPVVKAIEKALANAKRKLDSTKTKKARKVKIVFLSPSGKQFDTQYAKESAKKYEHVIIVCGRYEGIDARVKKIFKTEDVSVGPFVLTGGELAAMIMIDSISRQVEGVLGDFNSLEETRAASSDVYTRPEVLVYKNKKYQVPKVLLSGNHKAIEEWRKGESD